MSKSTVLQIVSAIILVLGGILIYQYLTIEDKTVSILPGIGVLTIGIALLVISKNKRVTGRDS